MCFLAQSNRGVQVVIKRFKPYLFKKNKEKNAYEAVILSQLSHSAIPELLGIVNEKGFYGFVLELKPGYTVEEMLFKQKRRFSETEIFHIGLELIKIVKYLHHKGVVHRDIRIPNVIIDGDSVYLVDFGLARWADDRRYTYDIDFSYLGDYLLYLMYSSYKREIKGRSRPWYHELPLSAGQQSVLKRLLKLETPYESIHEVETDFIRAFGGHKHKKTLA